MMSKLLEQQRIAANVLAINTTAANSAERMAAMARINAAFAGRHLALSADAFARVLCGGAL